MFNSVSKGLAGLCIAALGLAGCATDAQPTEKRIPAGQEFAGFLSDYSKLKPSPRFAGEALTYANADAEKNLRRYFAITLDPVEVYMATDAHDAHLPKKSKEAATRYFEWALTKAVSDAYPIVSESGPLVLKLRAALVGVDTGGQVAPAVKPADPNDQLDTAVSIEKVGVEMELLDSETGEQIAAMVDRAPLGSGASVASANIPSDERSMAAREAFDEWASRLREFLDAQHELSEQDAQRALQSYQPYGSAPTVQ